MEIDDRWYLVPLRYIRAIWGDPKLAIPKRIVVVGLALISYNGWLPLAVHVLEVVIGGEWPDSFGFDWRLHLSGWGLVLVGIWLYCRTVPRETVSARGTAAPLELSVPSGAQEAVKANAIDAITNLFCAGLDWPTAHFQAKAREAREAFTAEGYEASSLHEIKLLSPREINLLQVTEHCQKAFDDPPSSPTQRLHGDDNDDLRPRISLDWVNAFAREASLASSGELQDLFGRILAGEIVNPGSFSIRTVRTLSELDRESAEVFQKLCSISFVGRPANAFGDPQESTMVLQTNKKLSDFLDSVGVTFQGYLKLTEQGIVSPARDAFWAWSVDEDFRNEDGELEPVSMSVSGRELVVDFGRCSNVGEQLHIPILLFTQVGHELSEVVDKLENPQYLESLVDWFKEKHPGSTAEVK